MTVLTRADDLLIAPRSLPGSDQLVGVEMTGPFVSTGFFARLSGVLQRRNRPELTCWAQIQTGWPVGRGVPDASPLAPSYYPAVWITLGTLPIPVDQAPPVTFTLAPGFRALVIFPLVRVRWILSAGASSLLATDQVIVSARLETYRV
jgi:hypothetical protein